jgi:hypothetical protein
MRHVLLVMLVLGLGMSDAFGNVGMYEPSVCSGCALLEFR